jgi:mono/diheme cytochrome c family protein
MTVKTTCMRIVLAGGVAAAAAVLSTAPGEAHKAITSKYTYNDDVFPILRDRCSRCHVAGGVAPMSLMTYDDAFPWAESIRAELVAGHMPPWNADEAFGDLKRAHTLSPKEIDIVLTWATGGNPRGALDQKLPEVTLKNEWTLGAPDLALKLPAEFTLAADKMEDTQEFTLAAGTTEAKWVRAVDLLPGTPSIVRSATIFVKDASTQGAAGSASPNASSAPATTTPERVLAHWLPGQDPEPADSGAAFRLPAAAQIVVRIHYKKTWQFEGKAVTDRSTVGVYLAPVKEATELLTVPIESPAIAPGQSQTVTFSRTLGDDVRAIALSPDSVPPNISVQVEAVRPDGSRTPMIRLNTRADWDRRYWFEKPLALTRGTKIEVTANFEDPDLLSAAFSTPLAASTAAAKPATMRLALNVLPANSKPTAP